MAQRNVETLIGRLLTDEQFRTEFLNDPTGRLLDLCALGFGLSRTEIAALVNTDRALWARAADLLDPRLQKAGLTSDPSLKERQHHV